MTTTATHQHLTATDRAGTTYRYVASPLGQLLLVGRDEALTGLYLADHERAPRIGARWAEDPGGFTDVVRQLDEYFAHERRTFDVLLQLDGTPFQIAVWTALRDIGYGTTMSYAELARRLGRPTATRAVGAANGRNPVSIIVPCHRVIAAGGGLGGYGWGLDAKAWLLDHERGAGRLL